LATTPGESEPAGDRLVLYLTGETRGNLTPCACPDAPWGGLGRRVGFLRDAAQRNPQALVLDAGGFLPVGEVPLRDDPEAGRRLVTLLLNSISASGIVMTAVEPGVASFLRRTAPIETARIEESLLITHPPGQIRLRNWNGHKTAIYAVDRSWADDDLRSIGDRARALSEVTIVLARANAIDGRRVARLTQADVVALSRGGRPKSALLEGRSSMVGAGKLGKEVAEVVLVPDGLHWRVEHYEHHPMDGEGPLDSGFRAAVKTLLEDYGPGWEVLTTVLD